jgi:hypothetical protein
MTSLSTSSSSSLSFGSATSTTQSSLFDFSQDLEYLNGLNAVKYKDNKTENNDNIDENRLFDFSNTPQFRMRSQIQLKSARDNIIYPKYYCSYNSKEKEVLSRDDCFSISEKTIRLNGSSHSYNKSWRARLNRMLNNNAACRIFRREKNRTIDYFYNLGIDGQFIKLTFNTPLPRSRAENNNDSKSSSLNNSFKKIKIAQSLNDLRRIKEEALKAKKQNMTTVEINLQKIASNSLLSQRIFWQKVTSKVPVDYVITFVDEAQKMTSFYEDPNSVKLFDFDVLISSKESLSSQATQTSRSIINAQSNGKKSASKSINILDQFFQRLSLSNTSSSSGNSPSRSLQNQTRNIGQQSTSSVSTGVANSMSS